MTSLAPSIMGSDRSGPVGAFEFAGLMAEFEPFEPLPHLAVAVSGGSDSMALALLAADWGRARGGRLTALTVDHGLRLEAAAEARQVGLWCAARGLAHEILAWSGPIARSGIQAAARAARYQLLEEWCRGHDVLHLLVAHHRDDQAETVLIRLMRSSGSDGLSGMSALVEHGSVRVLRPLLGVPRSRLQATLEAAGQGWIEDPSNRNPAYLRARLRARLREKAGADFTTERWAGRARQFGRARAALEAERATVLAQAVSVHPAGFVWLDPAKFIAAPKDVALRALAAIITMVSGANYPPRTERLERLLGLLAEGLPRGRTLGGCRILARRGRILIGRESAAVAPPVAVATRGSTLWDGRFRLDLEGPEANGLWLGPLGAEAAAAINRVLPPVAATIPPILRPSLPTLRDAQGIVAVPALHYRAERCQNAGVVAGKLLFCPTRPLTGGGFRIV